MRVVICGKALGFRRVAVLLYLCGDIFSVQHDLLDAEARIRREGKGDFGTILDGKLSLRIHAAAGIALNFNLTGKNRRISGAGATFGAGGIFRVSGLRRELLISGTGRIFGFPGTGGLIGARGFLRPGDIQ